MDKPEEIPPKKQLHPSVKQITTLISYAMLQYHDSKTGKLVDITKLSQAEVTLYMSQLHARVFQEMESNKYFRQIVLSASKLILHVAAGGNVT